jgi:hypothetical protein
MAKEYLGHLRVRAGIEKVGSLGVQRPQPRQLAPNVSLFYFSWMQMPWAR